MEKIPKIKIHYIPVSSPNRPGTKSHMQWITIHNTGNPNSTAQNERDYVAVRRDNVSFHYAVDDKEVIAIIPEDEIAWHTGTKEGNKSSIGIEICESGNQEVTYKNAIGLIAKILKKRNWGIDRVRSHKSWNGKNCPRKLLPIWDKFIQDIELVLQSIEYIEKNINPVSKSVLWKLQGLHYLHENGLLKDIERWTKEVEKPIPVWAATLLLSKIHKDLVERMKKEKNKI